MRIGATNPDRNVKTFCEKKNCAEKVLMAAGTGLGSKGIGSRGLKRLVILIF